MIQPAIYDLVIYKSDDFEFEFQLTDEGTGTPMDLTGCTVIFQVRENADSSTALLSLSEGSGITVNDAEGIVTVRIPRTQTANLTWTQGVYGLAITDAADRKFNYLQGSVTVVQGVAR